jgi:hypothetical protein
MSNQQSLNSSYNSRTKQFYNGYVNKIKKASREKSYSKLYGDFPRNGGNTSNFQKKKHNTIGSYQQTENKLESNLDQMKKSFANSQLNLRGSFRRNPELPADHTYNYPHSFRSQNQRNFPQNVSYKSFRVKPNMVQSPSHNFYKSQKKPNKKEWNETQLGNIKSPPSSHLYLNLDRIKNNQSYKKDFSYQQSISNDFQYNQTHLMQSRSYNTSPKQSRHNLDMKMEVLTSKKQKRPIQSYQDDCFYMNLEEEYLHLVTKRNQNKFSNRSMHTTNY